MPEFMLAQPSHKNIAGDNILPVVKRHRCLGESRTVNWTSTPLTCNGVMCGYPRLSTIGAESTWAELILLHVKLSFSFTSIGMGRWSQEELCSLPSYLLSAIVLLHSYAASGAWL